MGGLDDAEALRRAEAVDALFDSFQDVQAAGVRSPDLGGTAGTERFTEKVVMVCER